MSGEADVATIYTVTDTANQTNGLGDVYDIVAASPRAAAEEYARNFDIPADMPWVAMEIIVRWGDSDAYYEAEPDDNGYLRLTGVQS